MKIFGLVVIILCLIWLIIGFYEAYKIYKKEYGFHPEQVAALFVFFFLPSLFGIAIGIIGFVTK